MTDYIARALWRAFELHEHGPECINRDDTDDSCTETRTLKGAAEDRAKEPMQPDFRDNVEHVYDVKVSIAVGLNFDSEPTELELRFAMLESFIDKINSAYTFDVDLDDDIEYELLEITDHMEDE